MGGIRLIKRTDMKDNDWVILHREPGGFGSPRLEGGPEKRYGMTVRDFLSDLPANLVSDTDCPNSGVKNMLMRPVGFEAGQPVVADVNWVVTIADMKVGAYTVANASPAGGIAMNLTVTHLKDGANLDTVGTIDIVGTDIDDQVLLETITPSDDATVQGLRAFKTVTSVTGVGWVISGAGVADTITVGTGELIGLPDYMVHDRVLFVSYNNVREATHPTVTSSITVLALNTVDLNTGLGGLVVVIYYLV